MADDRVVIPLNDVRHFIVKVMRTLGATEDHSALLAEVLTTADLRGHYSHGLNRLDMYVGELRTGVTIKADEKPVILKETCATALVDGKSLLGPVVGKFCIDLAIEKAKEAGIGWVSCRGSNHFGIAGWYSMRAMNNGLVGMAFTNTSPSLVPTRAKKGTLGTNPITVAAAGCGEDQFVLDMATTSVARGKVEIQKVTGKPMPTGWAVDKDGHEITDPDKFYGLQPLGGTEECRIEIDTIRKTKCPTVCQKAVSMQGFLNTLHQTWSMFRIMNPHQWNFKGGYKGYGLAMMVEIFCGMLSGSTYGPHVRGFKQHINPANLGQCFVAINPACFADGFEDRLSSLMNYIRNLEPVDQENKVLIPGDPEREHCRRMEELGGIPYHKGQVQEANRIAREVGVEDLRRL